MISINNDILYSCTDLSLAALLAIYYPLEAIDWNENQHKAKFLFKKDSQLDQLVQSFWRGELRIDPKVYFSSLRLIKGRLYESK